MHTHPPNHLENMVPTRLPMIRALYTERASHPLWAFSGRLDGQKHARYGKGRRREKMLLTFLDIIFHSKEIKFELVGNNSDVAAVSSTVRSII